MINIPEVTELIEAKNQLKKAHEKLSKYEKELIIKDQLINSKEREAKSFVKTFSEEKSRLDEERQVFEQLKTDFELKQIDFESKELRLLKDQENLKSEKAAFLKENQEIYSLKSKIEKDVEEIEKLFALNSIQSAQLSESQKNLEESQAKLSKEYEIFEEHLKNLETSKEKLFLEQGKLQIERESLNSDRRELEKTLKNVKKEQEKLKNDTENIEKLRKKLEIQKLELNLLCEASLHPESLRISDLLERLELAMEVYNEEVTKRELLLAQKHSEILADSRKILDSMVKIREIHDSLERTKHEIHVFYTEIVPSLEFAYSKSKEIQESLNSKFKVVEGLFVRITESALRLANVKDPGVSFMAFHEKNYDMTKKERNEYLFDVKNVETLTKELLARIKGLNLKELEVDKKARDQALVLEYINKAKESISDARRDLDIQREKVNEQGAQIDFAFKALGNKECEIRVLIQELEKRKEMLKKKENLIEMRMFQLRESKYSIN
jgi:chromosome segregation ATPase